MSPLVSWAKKEMSRLRIYHRFKRLQPPPTTSASTKALIPMPPVNKEVVLSADLQCPKCQKRVADVISNIDDVEAMVVHVLEKKVTLIRKNLIT